MDLQAIQDAIEILEHSTTTMENVDELSKLYIVREQLAKSSKQSNDKPKILPSYDSYIETKRQFQMHQIPEDAVILSIKDVCQELNDLIEVIYSNSDLRRERRCLRDCIIGLNNKYGK